MKITSIPQIYRNVNRWGEILSILSKFGLADWISRFDLSFAKGLLKNRNGEVLARHARPTRIRLALEELGPAFIKLGQILSTRPDLVGLEMADELKKLQDSVPADSPEQVRETIETELGQPIDDLFLRFDDQPLASASMGQVHRAQLVSGEEAVVKVQHPGLEDRIRVDLEILVGLAQLAERIPELAIYRPRSTVAEFQRALRRELDFGREERNLQQFARDFQGDPTVRIPQSFPELSTGRVLTMEALQGIKLSDPHLDEATDLDLDQIARNGAEIYINMIFQNGFYHADPHPGNLMLLPKNTIGLIDFGMVGRIDDTLRENIEDMLMAIVDHDPNRLTSVITRIGAVPQDLDENAFSVEVTDFVEHYTHQPMQTLDLSGALSEMIEIIRRYHIVLPAPMAMLLKVLIMLEGTAKLVSPQFSLMDVLEPYRRKMALARLSPSRQLRKMRRIYYELEQLAELLPRRVRVILQQVQSGKFDVHLDHRGLEPSVNRLVLGMLASALFLGSSLLISREVGPALIGINVLGGLGYIVALVLGLRLLRAISKSGHLDRRQK